MTDYSMLKLENQLCFPLYAAAKEVVRLYTPYLKPIDLTYTQYIAMMVFWDEKEVVVKDLCERLYLDTGTLTPLLRKLEDKGLITLEPLAQDRRSVLAQVTAQGMKLRESAAGIPEQVGSCLSISQDEAAQLYMLTNKVLNKFENNNGGTIMSIYNFSVKNSQGEMVSLEKYRGKVLLVVNTATKCGLTPQYDALEALYEKYQDEGFEVLDFPSNQFMNQAPGTDEEISEFCTLNFNTTFPRFAKIDVNGKDADPLFVWLKKQAPVDEEKASFDKMSKLMKPFAKAGDISWNFGKFLVDRNGEVAGRFSPGYTPDNLEARIEELLAQ